MNASSKFAFPYRQWLTVIVLCGLLFTYRSHQYSNLEPRIDQSLYASYIRAVVEADHTIPRSSTQGSFRSALETDQQSRLHQIAIMLKNNQNLVSMAAYLTFAIAIEAIFNTDYKTLALLSIAFSVLSCGLAAFWVGSFAAPSGKDFLYLPALIAFICYGLAFYPNWFSSFGPHNFGVLGLLAGVISLQWAFDSSPSGSWNTNTWRIVLLVHAFAFLTHWTTVILLLPVTLLAIVAYSGGIKYTIKPLAMYVLFTCVVVLLPWMGMHIISGDPVTSSTKWLMGPIGAKPQLEMSRFLFRIVDWFRTSTLEFSIFGLVSGVLGCAYLAWIHKKYLPVCVLFVHFLCWVVMPGFTDNGTPTFLRTINYLFPFLAIGMGALSVLPFSSLLSKNLKFMVSVGLAVFILAHLYIQFNPLIDQQNLAQREPRFIESYLRGQGTLRPFAREADSLIADGSTVIANHYSARVNFQTMRPALRKQLNWLPELDSLLEQTIAGNYKPYAQRRGILQNCKSVYLFSRDELTSTPELERSLQSVFGDMGMGCQVRNLTSLKRWTTNITAFESVSLYRIDLTGPVLGLK